MSPGAHVWSRSRARLLWVDTSGASLNFFDPATGRNVEYSMPGPLGFVVEKNTGELLIGIGCHALLCVWRSGDSLSLTCSVN